jgi:hypothetical protein
MAEAPMRERLAGYLRELADRRDEQAARQPEDSAAAHAADQLRFVADYVEALPHDDPYLRALAAVHNEREDAGIYVPSESARTLLAGFPLPHEPDKPERFLADLLAAEVGDGIDSAREEGR